MVVSYEELCTLAYAERLLQLKKDGKSDYQKIADYLSNLFGEVISFTDICSIFEPSIQEEELDLKTHLKHFNYD